MPARTTLLRKALTCLMTALCVALAACAAPVPRPPTFEVVLNKDVRLSLPLALFENAIILDTFGVRFQDGASLSLSSMNTLVDLDYLEDIRVLPAYMLGLREIAAEGFQARQFEELLGMREMVRRYVGEGAQAEVFETPRGKVYALIGQSRAIAYITYAESADVLLCVTAKNMDPDAFRNVIRERFE
ncbi:MAG: hypothetical protein ACK4KV_05890 [Rhodocyclaceae bacterium]